MVVTSDRNFILLNNKDFYHLLDKTQTAIGEKSGPIRILSFSFVLPPLDPLLALQTLESHSQGYGPGHGSSHSSSHDPDHGPGHSSSHGSSHGPGHSSSHGPGHSSSHGPGHSSSHGPGHSSSHGPDHSPTAAPVNPAAVHPAAVHPAAASGSGPTPSPAQGYFPHFYWEWTGNLDRSQTCRPIGNGGQPTAILAAGHTAQVEFQGEQRFQQSRHFAEQCFSQTVQIHLDPRPEFLPFGGPHLFCSFTFFDQPSPVAPFAPATLFLPRWHLARHGSHSILVINCPWSGEIHREGGREARDLGFEAGLERDREVSLEALCRSIWQAVAPLRDPGADLAALAALLKLPAFPPTPLVWTAHTVARPRPPAPAASPLAPGPLPHSPPPSPSQHHFKQAVQESLEAIAAGTLGKIVLAHTLEVTSPQPFQVSASLRNLRRLHPDCYCFSVGNGQGQTFLGASPERLLCIAEGDLQTEALAGSAPRGETPREDEQLARSLLQNPKERHEHHLVAEFILERLQSLGLNPQAIAVPRLRQLANIQHLLTPIQATVPPQVHPLDLVAQLHPTPAVAGVPRQVACDQIRRWEPFDRSLYAAPLGWLDHRGNCEFIVGIRSALLDGDRARLFAGAGVVSGSDPDRELTEVELKFQTLLSALV